MKRLAFAFGVTLVVLMLLSLLTRLSGGGGDEAVREAESHLYYVVERDRSLALRVASGTHRVKLVSLLRMPVDEVRDTEQVQEFGVDVLLLDPDGNELWRKPVWFRSRCSEQEGLTDDRVVELDVSPLAEEGGTLRLEVAGESQAPILVRGFRRYQRSFDDVPNTVGHQGEIKRRQRAQRVGVSAWSALQPEERADLHSFKWKPMEAIGSPGRDYSTERVVLQDRERSVVDDGQDGRLEPGRATAFTLVGPSRFQVTGRSLADGGTALLVVVNSMGEVRESSLELDGSEASVQEIVLEEDESATLSIYNDGDGPMTAQVATADAPHGLFGGTSARIDSDSGRFVLGPDYSSVRMVRLGPSAGVHYGLPYMAHSSMRIETRSVGDWPVDVTLALLDEEGGVIGSSTLRRPASPTPYEATRVTGPGQNWEPSGRAQTAEFWTDARARSVRLTAGSPVDVRILAPVGDGLETLSREPYRIETSGSSLRYEPLAASAWQPLRAREAASLAAQGGEALVLSQVRLEPTDVVEAHPLGWPLASPARSQVTLVPTGHRARQRLVERWSGGGWPASARTRLVPGEISRLGEGQGREATLEVWVDDAQRLGETILVRCDGEELTAVDLQATYLRRQLALPPECALTLEGPTGGYTALLDQPTRGGGARRYRSRTVHRFDQNDPLELDLRLPPDGDGAVLLMAYYEVPAGSRWPRRSSRVRVTLTGRPAPAPGEVYRRTTNPVAEYVLSPAGGDGFLADRKGQVLVEAIPIRVSIGDDLSGREVGVRIERLDDGEPLWVRLVGVAIKGEESSWRNQYVDRPVIDGLWPLTAVSTEHGDTLPDVVETELQTPRGTFQPLAPEGMVDVRELGWQLGSVARDGTVEAAGALPVAVEKMGFELQVLQALGQPSAGSLLWLRDAQDEGRGGLWLRFASSSPVMLQAPHAFADQGTGRLAAMFMEESAFRSLQYNTRHRRGAAEDGILETDLAHVDESWFQGLTLGLLDGDGPALLVQLHGFSRDTVPDPAVDVVVSGGLPAVDDVVDAFIFALANGAPDVGVARFPDEIDRLGGLSNVQGAAILGDASSAFLHLELSPEIRERLLDSPQLRQAFTRAIEEAATTLERAGEEQNPR